MAKQCISRLCTVFFSFMLICTFVSWRLDDLQTPRVVCSSPTWGQLADSEGVITNYNCVVPLESLMGADGNRYIYLVEETNSYFAPLVARRVYVTVLAYSESAAAVSGIFSDDAQVVRFSGRPLIDDTVPVKMWEGSD